MENINEFLDSSVYTDRITKIIKEANSNTPVDSLPSITTTYLFNILNDANGGSMMNRLLSVVNGKEVTEDEIAINLLEIKNYKFPKKDEIMGMMMKNILRLKFDTKVTNKLNSSIPVILSVNNGKIISNVNLTNYSKYNADESFNISTINLYALMNSGYIHNMCMTKFKEIKYDYKLLELGAICYSKLFTSIFIKRHSVNTMPIVLDTIAYLSAKFFLFNVCKQVDTDFIINIARKCTGFINPAGLEALDSRMVYDQFESLPVFFNKLREIVPQISKTTLRDFIHAYVNSYGDTTLFAIEWMPAFFTMVANCEIGSFINKKIYIDNVLGKNSTALFNAIMK